MKKAIRNTVAMMLLLVMATISPMTDLSPMVDGTQGKTTASDKADSRGAVARAATVAKAAGKDEQGNQLYISDIKIGNAYVDGEAKPEKGMKDETTVAAELESEGYTILRDGNGYANLNDGAGTDSGLKVGANHKIILLGYKTTTNPADAITDLAVMNMNGGYSIKDYKSLIETQMNSRIRPFVDHFITSIEEYRANYRMPDDTVNHKRADMSRRLMNKFTDDDTGGMPVGDLLLNKTKYEMGDAAYGKLSDAEKKKHADILTMLLQGNTQAVLAIETLLSKATDTSEDTWLDRMQETDLDSLVEEVKAEKPSLTTRSDIFAALDKKYYDAALTLRQKWDASESLFNDIDTLDTEAIEAIEKREEKDPVKGPDTIKDNTDAKKALDSIVENTKDYTDAMTDNMKLRISALAIYLDTIEFGNGTMLEYFQGKGEYQTSEKRSGIRALYPMVASLSEGQKEGLEFLSIIDLLSIAVDDGESMKTDLLDQFDAVSVYDEVNREVFDTNGVAITNDALRVQSSSLPEDKPSTASAIHLSTWILWGASAIAVAGTITSGVIWRKAAVANAAKTTTVANNSLEKIVDVAENNVDVFERNNSFVLEDLGKMSKYQDVLNTSLDESAGEIARSGSISYNSKVLQNLKDAAEETIDDVVKGNDQLVELQGQPLSGAYSKAFYIFVGVAVVLILVSTWKTLLDISDSYDADFVTIPKYMVDEVEITTYNEKGEKIFINNQTAYYRVANCNRVDGDSKIEKKNHKILLDRADLNGDIGRQWLALYYVKNKYATPILADSLLYRKGDSDLPSGYTTGIHEFGSTAAANLNRKGYLFADNPPAIHVFFKNAPEVTVTNTESISDNAAGSSATGSGTDSNPVSGTAGSIFPANGFTVGDLALNGGFGILLGALLMALILYLIRRKKASDKQL